MSAKKVYLIHIEKSSILRLLNGGYTNQTLDLGHIREYYQYVAYHDSNGKRLAYVIRPVEMLWIDQRRRSARLRFVIDAEVKALYPPIAQIGDDKGEDASFVDKIKRFLKGGIGAINVLIAGDKARDQADMTNAIDGDSNG